MQPAEQAQREVPGTIVDELERARVRGEATAQPRVQRRPTVAKAGLTEKMLRRTSYFANAAFACAAISPNFFGSLTARSARTFRSSSTFAALSPAMNWL